MSGAKQARAGPGRPREFDEGEALERAMQLFWSRGYESTRLTDLLAEMGISRQSLYSTFGNKRALFLRTIDHYRETQLSAALKLLAREGPPLDNVRAVIGFFHQLAGDARCRGCLVANALVEVAPHDPEIALVLSDTLELLQQRIESALDQARQRGDLPPGRSPRTLSQALTNAMLGLAVSGKLERGPEVLDEIHEGTLRLLD
ncbi:MAG: TetR/AcrR family transcriptional regulator [Myxococcota bacterium]